MKNNFKNYLGKISFTLKYHPVPLKRNVTIIVHKYLLSYLIKTVLLYVNIISIFNELYYAHKLQTHLLTNIIIFQNVCSCIHSY